MVVPVILSGGSGSRLWPKSRQHFPKQLHRFYGDKTLLQQTLWRVKHLSGSPIIICNQEQRFMVAEQARQVAASAEIILEPVARNTAPAIVIAALKSLQEDKDAIIAVFAADHLIKNQSEFERSLGVAIAAASQNALVTFGVVPTHPETGYGYIRATKSENEDVCNIQAFVEKPSLDLAKDYVASGDYYWNSGMFVFCAKTLVDECEKFHPQMVKQCRQALGKAQSDLDFLRLDHAAFADCESESIDYAVMERTTKAVMVPLSAEWSDVGSWESLWEVTEQDASGNAIEGDVILRDSKNCYASSEGRLVAMVGVEDLVVVETADSVLVLNKSRSQDVKHIVKQLEATGRKEYQSHREVFRPWGSYDLVNMGERYSVKKITVKPGASISLQMHHHRAEHWVVVCGTAEVERGEVKETVSENQSVYIPIGQKHRLKNPGVIALELIEVASGSYLGEDDVVRLEDAYGRVEKAPSTE